MKRSEIRKCSLCHKGVMHTGVPLFWRVTIDRFGIDVAAVNRRAGLETHFGGGVQGAQLAEIMGPNEDLAKPVIGTVELVVCEECGTGRNLPVAALAERGEERG